MFDDYFEVFLADTLESKTINYSIRYNVYCEEKEFANKNDFPQKLEIDEFDDSSIHFIIRHIPTGQWIGAMRLVFKNNNNLLFPMEKVCSINEDIDMVLFNQSVELSRLCIIKEIRKGYTDTATLYGLPEISTNIIIQQPNDIFNHCYLRRSILFGLVRAVAKYCYENNIKNWYFLTTTALSKVLSKGGLNLLKVGDSCHHYGERYPYKMDAIETFHNHAAWKDDYKNGYRYFSQVDC